MTTQLRLLILSWVLWRRVQGYGHPSVFRAAVLLCWYAEEMNERELTGRSRCRMETK